jgi:hypothetical protein
MRLLPKRTWQWTVVVPEEFNDLAGHINGTVHYGDGHWPLHFRHAALYKRRVWLFHRWRLAEIRGWDAANGCWEENKPRQCGPGPDGGEH